MSVYLGYTPLGLLTYKDTMIGVRIRLESNEIDNKCIFDLGMNLVLKYQIPFETGFKRLETTLVNEKYVTDTEDSVDELTEDTKGFYALDLMYSEEWGYSNYFTCDMIDDCSICPLEDTSQCSDICQYFVDTYKDTSISEIQAIIIGKQEAADAYWQRVADEKALKRIKAEETAEKRRQGRLANSLINSKIKQCKNAIKAYEKRDIVINSNRDVNALMSGKELPKDKYVSQEIEVLRGKLGALLKERSKRNKERAKISQS